MKRHSRNWGYLQFALLILMVPPDAYAYIDPNTAGWLFQLIFPVIVAIGIGWNFLRNRMRAALDWVLRRTKQLK